MKKRKSIVLGLLLTGVILTTGCSQSDIDKQIQPQEIEKSTQKEEQAPKKSVSEPAKSVEENDSQNDSQKEVEQLMKKKINAQDKQIKELTEEVEYYRNFVKDFTSTFTTEELNQFIDKECTYQLAINNISFPKNGLLELSESNFNLILKEDRVKYSVLSEEISQKGKINGGIVGKLSFLGDIRPKENTNIQDRKSIITYSFTDVRSGTTIKMRISDDLKNKLKIETNDLEIQVKD